MVLCHPHPLYGGTMQSAVVLTARDAALDLGHSTLRFDFRGVGRSTGQHDEGRGEAHDVRAACDHAANLGGAHEPVHLIAYSFGAWVALRACAAGLAPSSLTLIAPPVGFLDFSAVAAPGGPLHVIVGSEDEYCSSVALVRWLDGAGRADVRPEILARTGHFFAGREVVLQSLVRDILIG